MTMVDHVLCNLKAADNAMLLEVGLPWFRSLPLSCVNGLIVTIGEQRFDDLEIQIGDEFLPISSLAELEFGEWFLQDRKQVRIPISLPKGELQKVRAEFDMVIANIFAGPNQPVHLPMISQAELQVL